MIKKWLNQGIQRPLGTPFAYEVSVGAVVFRIDTTGRRQYLLLRYPYGYWDYVKGHVEDSETQMETLARETQEETGLALERVLPGFHERSRYRYIAKGNELAKRRAARKGTWIYKVVHFYLAEAAKGPVRISDEHVGSGWFSHAEAREKLVFARSKEILDKAEKLLSGNAGDN